MQGVLHGTERAQRDGTTHRVTNRTLQIAHYVRRSWPQRSPLLTPPRTPQKQAVTTDTVRINYIYVNTAYIYNIVLHEIDRQIAAETPQLLFHSCPSVLPPTHKNKKKKTKPLQKPQRHVVHLASDTIYIILRHVPSPTFLFAVHGMSTQQQSIPVYIRCMQQLHRVQHSIHYTHTSSATTFSRLASMLYTVYTLQYLPVEAVVSHQNQRVLLHESDYKKNLYTFFFFFPTMGG